MELSSIPVVVAGQTGRKSRQAENAYVTKKELANKAELLASATKRQRTASRLPKADRTPAPKGRGSRCYSGWDTQDLIHARGRSVDDCEAMFAGEAPYRATRKQQATPAVARKGQTRTFTTRTPATPALMASDAVATLTLLSKAAPAPANIQKCADEADSALARPQSQGGKEEPPSQEGAAARAVTKGEGEAAAAAAEPAEASTSLSPRKSSGGAAAFQRGMSAVKCFPEKLVRGMDAFGDALAAGADQLGARLRTTSTKCLLEVKASLAEAKTVVDDKQSEAAQAAKRFLKGLKKGIRKGLTRAFVCGAGSLPLEPVAVSVAA